MRIDKEKIKLRDTQIVGLLELMQIIGLLEQRNQYCKHIGIPGETAITLDMIGFCNEKIKEILNL